MIQRNNGENTTAECRHDSHEATDKQKRRKYILWVLRFRDEPMTAMEIAKELYKTCCYQMMLNQRIGRTRHH